MVSSELPQPTTGISPGSTPTWPNTRLSAAGHQVAQADDGLDLGPGCRRQFTAADGADSEIRCECMMQVITFEDQLCSFREFE